MTDSGTIEDIVRRYTELLCHGDVDGIVNLFRADGRMFDPVDHSPHSGVQALRDFFQEATKLVDEIRTTGPVCVSKNEEHAAVAVHLDVAGRRIEIDAVLVFDFGAGREIGSLKVYWGPDNMRAVPERA